MRYGRPLLVCVGLYGDGVFDGKGGKGLFKWVVLRAPRAECSLEDDRWWTDISEVDGFFEFEGADVCDGLGGHIGTDCDERWYDPPAVSSSYLRSSRTSSESSSSMSSRISSR